MFVMEVFIMTAIINKQMIQTNNVINYNNKENINVGTLLKLLKLCYT